MTTDPDRLFVHRESLPTPRGPVEIGVTGTGLDLHPDHAGFADDVRRLERACGVPLAWSRQVHEDGVVVLDRVEQPPPTADALITRSRGLGLITRVADCVPVVLVDATTGLLAVVHSGRPGTALDIVTTTVDRLRELGALAPVAWVGPGICGGCYEVPETLRETVAASVPGSWATTTWGTPALDLAAGVRGQLDRAGVGVREFGGCTREDPALHSFRRDGQAAGRCAAVVWAP